MAFSATHRRAGIMAAGSVAAAALALAGCSTAPASHQAGGQTRGSGQGHSGGQAQSGGQGHAAASRAIAMAARSAAKLTSMTMTETMTMHGIPLSGGGLVPGAGAGSGANASGKLTMRMTARMRFKPTILAALAMDMNIGSRSVVLDEILTSRAVYLKVPGVMPAGAGRPWAKINIASLPNHANLQKLFAQTQKGNPLTAMGNPAGLAKFLAAARDVRVVRNQIVDGVQTTEYSGLVNLRSFLPSMPAQAQQMFGSLGPATTRFWIDHQHQMRKLVMRLSLGQVSIAMAANVTSINKPVSIVPPPADRVSPLSHL